MTSELQSRAPELRAITAECETLTKSVKHFPLQVDPLAQEAFEPAYRTCIPVYDACLPALTAGGNAAELSLELLTR